MAYIASPNGLINLARADQPRPYTLNVTDDYFATYAQIFQYQPEVRTVVSFLARNVAQLNMQVFRRVDEDNRERLTDHPLALYFRRPNPWTSQYRLWNALMCDLCIYDLGLAVKIGSPSAPASIRIPPWRAKPVGDNWVTAEKWEVTGSKGKVTYNADQLIVMHGYNPSDDRIGLSPLESLRSILAEEYEATRNRQQAWRNGSRYTGIVNRPVNAPKWSETAKERFKASFAAGPAGPAGANPILEDGMTYTPTSMTPAQMEYIEGRRLTREEVAAAYFVPPPMVGILDNANYSNVEMFHRSLYQDTLGPWLTLIQQEYALQLLGDVVDTDDVYVEFNLREKLEGSFAEQAQVFSTAIGRPWMTADEGRGRMNMPALGGDAAELVTPLNVIVGGQASPTDSAPDDPSTDGNPKASELTALHGSLSEVISLFLARQGKSIQSRLGATPGDDWWDEKRWDRELTDDLSVLVSRPLAASLATRINDDTKAAVSRALKMADPRAEVAAVFAPGGRPEMTGVA